MIFQIKRKLMCKALAKRNVEKPFDYQFAENFSLKGETDPMVNNSYYFSAHDEKMSIFARLGRRINQDETWFAVFQDGKWYSLKQEVYPAGQSPIAAQKVNGTWTLTFKGTLNEADEVEFSGKFVSNRQPIDFTSNMPAVRMATGIANEKWSKDYFSSLQNVNGQCHYEQEGALEGQLTINGKTTAINMPCVRDHSFGKRDWDYMNNHLWLMAVSPTFQFNYSLVSYPAITALEVGNYRTEDGMHYMMEADLNFEEVATGSVPKGLEFNVRMDNGKTMKVKATVIGGVTYHFQEDKYTLIENIADFEIDGKTCRGIFEIGFNKESNRFFNQRDLKTIKR